MYENGEEVVKLQEANKITSKQFLNAEIKES